LAAKQAVPEPKENAAMNSVDATAQLPVLSLLVQAAPSKGGQSATALRKLHDLPSGELLQLLRAGYPKASISLDFSGLEHGLRAIHDRQERANQLDSFIRNGATTALVRQLFRLPTAKIKARRAELLGHHRQRRPRMPHTAERDAVHAAWWQLRHGNMRRPPTIAHYQSLHDQFPHLSYATLYAVINEFEDELPPPPARVGR
jgi:hypothetical protein